jgi:hypothetical protein
MLYALFFIAGCVAGPIAWNYLELMIGAWWWDMEQEDIATELKKRGRV